MTRAARDLLGRALALPEDERIDLAAELLASVEGPADPDWDATWVAELDRRAATAADPQGHEWSAVRARLLDRLQRR